LEGVEKLLRTEGEVNKELLEPPVIGEDMEAIVGGTMPW
jgi:hypothetical protein